MAPFASLVITVLLDKLFDAKQRREHHRPCMTPRSRRTSREPPRAATGVALFISRCHLKPRNEIDLDHCPDADRGDRYRHLCRGATTTPAEEWWLSARFSRERRILLCG